MTRPHGIVVLDIGKTVSKASLWSRRGEPMARETRRNAAARAPAALGRYAALDADGIESWLVTVLTGFARLAEVEAIVPVGHGAAAAILHGDSLAAPPMDYEDPIPADVAAAYDALRDSFAATGSPRLADGLNLGAQLHRLSALDPDILGVGATIVPWSQYWAWRLSGVAASEVTSLGCHTDLWRPVENAPSDLARRLGWDAKLAPVRRADDVLGPVRAELAAATGLPTDAKVMCGIHDSNAALLAARGFADIAGREATVLSTGTWFVAMRSPAPGAPPALDALDEARDCLVNVDAAGVATPSARFMGGREIETLLGADAAHVGDAALQDELVAAAQDVIASRAMVLPTLTPGVGPFPRNRGRWVNPPASGQARQAAACLYAALVADTSLRLLGARDRVLVEGRFAAARVFVGALAALRPDMEVLAASEAADASFGALRLYDPGLTPPGRLDRIEAMNCDASSYREAWRELIARESVAA